MKLANLPMNPKYQIHTAPFQIKNSYKQKIVEITSVSWAADKRDVGKALGKELV